VASVRATAHRSRAGPSAAAPRTRARSTSAEPCPEGGMTCFGTARTPHCRFHVSHRPPRNRYVAHGAHTRPCASAPRPGEGLRTSRAKNGASFSGVRSRIQGPLPPRRPPHPWTLAGPHPPKRDR
jgi:hypothetical protein